MRGNSRLLEKWEDLAVLPVNETHDVSFFRDEDVVRVEVWMAERQTIEKRFFRVSERACAIHPPELSLCSSP